MNIDEFLQFIDYKITDGSPYMWDCFGKNARVVSYEDDCNFTVSAIFDTKTKFVYNLEVSDYKNRRCYRWISPLYREAYELEAKQREVDPNQAYDDVDFIDLNAVDTYTWKNAASIIIDVYRIKEEPVEMKDLLESTLLDFYRNYLDLKSNDNITVQINNYIKEKYGEE